MGYILGQQYLSKTAMIIQIFLTANVSISNLLIKKTDISIQFWPESNIIQIQYQQCHCRLHVMELSLYVTVYNN